MSLDKVVRYNTVHSENSKKLQEHNTTLEERKAYKAAQVEELLKQKEQLVEAGKAREAEALKRELEKVNNDLKLA